MGMNLRERMRVKIGTVIDNPDSTLVQWQQTTIERIREHIQAIRTDRFYGKADQAWIRQLNNQIRGLQKEMTSVH